MIHAAPKMTSNTTTSERWSGPKKYDSKTLCVGTGFIIEGVLKAVRMHLVTGVAGTDLPTRFIALQFQVSHVCRRKFVGGAEVLPDQNKTAMLTKGYLTKEKVVERSGAEASTASEIVSFIGPICTSATGFVVPSQKGKVHPAVSGVFEFWADAARFITSDFITGRKFRIKTKGDTIFVESATRMDDKSEKECLSYYAGEDSLSSSWNAKINQFKQGESKPSPMAHTAKFDSNNGDCAADDEWD